MSKLIGLAKKIVLGLACAGALSTASAEQVLGKVSGYLVYDNGGTELLFIRLSTQNGVRSLI